MKPLAIEDWVDYVRGLGSEDERRELRKRLASGTDETAVRDVRLLGEVARSIRDDADGPSPAAVWSAQAVAAVETNDLAELPRLPLSLISSTTPGRPTERRQPAYLGVRKLLYRSEHFELYLWLEDPPGKSDSVVLGRVSALHHGKPPDGVEDAAVFALEDGHVARSTLSNQFGEFHLEVSPEGRIDLKILIRDLGRIELSLPREEP